MKNLTSLEGDSLYYVSVHSCRREGPTLLFPLIRCVMPDKLISLFEHELSHCRMGIVVIIILSVKHVANHRSCNGFVCSFKSS